MSEQLNQLRQELRAELDRVRQAERAARKDGNVVDADQLVERIRRLEQQIDAMDQRLLELAKRGWHFSVDRNSDGFITTITASPIP